MEVQHDQNGLSTQREISSHAERWAALTGARVVTRLPDTAAQEVTAQWGGAASPPPLCHQPQVLSCHVGCTSCLHLGVLAFLESVLPE